MIDVKIVGLAGWLTGAKTFPKVYEKQVEDDFNAAIEKAFELTQRYVHVVTGSLKLSGKVVPVIFQGTEMTGGIEYGGESQGVNNPVEYAEAEYGRGGDHDFLTPALVETQPDMEAALGEAFEATISLWN